ncbi:hypothetical protein PAHAL_2G406500 [Panicum hallii]|uniref:F-box domain-containing protein n=1 Tax=Panicum hallii TaxID=206008 RepID=A0A2S3H361_9POAL|nr:hypothetical protein PAHAL_2G406500 [Panicum hallii]
MASPAAAGQLPLTDGILADILIRLPTLADFGRACASCPAFRRVITGHSFLRRLHALHPLSILGTPARALAEAADFDLSFLPKPGFWMVRDERGGRFVADRDEGRDDTFTTIAVCDPLFRSYVVLPPIRGDLSATVQQPLPVNAERRCHVFLAPSDEEEETAAGAPESFKWRAVAPARWSDLDPFMPSVTEHKSLHNRNYAYGCFYWSLSEYPYHPNLIVLDMDKMEFYRANPPPTHELEKFAIVELGESRLGMVVLSSSNIVGGALLLFSANRETHGTCASEWVLKNEVLLSRSYEYRMLGVADGKLLLVVTQNGRSAPEVRCVSLDFKTLQRQEIQGMIHRDFRPLTPFPLPALYIGYPPSLSLPTI